MSLTDTMAEALRLTRSGDLAGATELLRGGPSARPAPLTVHELTPHTIDLKAKTATLKPKAGAATSKPAAARAKAGPSARADATTARPVKASSHTSAKDAPGSFRAHNYSGVRGSIGYKLYTPRGAAPGMPLVVMLHGCTQSPDDFAAGTAMNTLADELGFFVAYPGQTHGRHPNKCWNWYRTGDQQRDLGEPALLAGLTRELIADHAIDPARVYAAGLSAGGAAAAVMASAYPDLYAAVGIHSGLACGSAHDTVSALAAMKQGAGSRVAKAGPVPERFVPVITFHGDRDSTVAEINAREIVAAASRDTGVKLTTSSETGRSAGGRAWTRTLSRDAQGNLLIEQWTIAGAGHAWSGGNAAGSYTDPAGPDASRAMLRFFLDRG